MVRRRIKDTRDRDQSASDSQHDQDDAHSRQYENASGLREESMDDNIRADEVDLHQYGPEEEDDLDV